jgi:hypothetical protein
VQKPPLTATAASARGTALSAARRPAASQSVLGRQLEQWSLVRLSDGSTVQALAESPGAALSELGAFELRVRHDEQEATVSGLSEVIPDLEGLTVRAGRQTRTAIDIEELASVMSAQVGGARVVRITLSTESGDEDFNQSYLENSLWAVAVVDGSVRLQRLWSGPGGEFHEYFGECVVGEGMDFVADERGAITRLCAVVPLRRSTHPECRRLLPKSCREGQIVAPYPWRSAIPTTAR